MSQAVRSPLYFGPDDAEMLPLYTAIGRAAMMWSNIENNLCQWYAVACNQEFAISRATFFSVSGYPNRGALLRAALRFQHMSDETTEFLESALKKTDSWSSARNMIAHGIPVRVGHPSQIEPMVSEGAAVNAGKVDLKRALSVPHLAVIAFNFRELAVALHDAHLTLYPLPPTPIGELRMRVRLLPNDPKIVESHSETQARRKQIEVDGAKRAAHAKSKKGDR
jgi:hypothetical protein